MPILSVIIPVFNVASYLDECLTSVTKQDYQDIEIICVDDGSTDDSGLILDTWGKRDNRIVVIHQKNQGVSSARNSGLRCAKGDFITFVDADDKVRHDIYTTSLKTMIEHCLDTFIFAFETFPKNKVETTGFITNEVLSHHQLFDSNPRIQTKNSLCFNWRFVFRANVLKNNQLLFDENIAIGEDMIYNIDAICHSHRIMVTDKPLYLYRKNNPNSAMSKNFKPKLEESLVRMYDHKIEQLSKYQLNRHISYVQDLAEYTILIYLRMLVENAYNNPTNKCSSIEIRRILSLPFIRNSFKTIGHRNIYKNSNEYLFYLAQKYRLMPIVMNIYNKLYLK